MIYFCNRGRENLRYIKKYDFLIEENNRYIEMRDMATKNHRGEKADEASQDGCIYKTGTKMCQFSSFMKYLSLLNPKCEAFFQRPKSKGESSPWYKNAPLGKNQLGDKMKNLSTEAKFSRTYTNHCLRTTSITLLDGYEARHVMTVSVHASESSHRSCPRTSEDQREKMALTLSKAISGTADDTDGDLGPMPGPSAPPQREIDFANLDVLELTASQETIVRKELITFSSEFPGPVTPIQPRPMQVNHLDISPFPAAPMQLQHSSYYGPPIYNIHNSSVHIYHN